MNPINAGPMVGSASSPGIETAPANVLTAVWGWLSDRPSVLRSFTLSVTLAAVVAASAIVGPDANWDLRNYHYYNGRALITGSFLTDVAPAGQQTYSNPFIDVPIYLFVHYIGPHWGIVLWAALLQWACYICVWRLCGALAPLSRSPGLRVLAFAMAITGSGAASLAFTTFGDWAVAGLICEAMARLIRWWDQERDRPRDVFVGGVLIGIAVGIKLTAASFALAAALALLVTFGWLATRRLIIGVMIGLTMVGGPWMAVLMIRFGNPVFPYYNTVFKSASGPDHNFDDARYGSRSLVDVVEFPIRMFRGSIEYTEIALRDWRFCALLLVLGVAIALASDQQLRAWRTDRTIRFWATFMAVGYISWIVTFGIYRYFLFGELVASLLIVAVLASLKIHPAKVRMLIASLIVGGLTIQTLPQWGRGNLFANPDLESAVAALPTDEPYVVFMGGPPFAYLTESFPTGARFAALFGFQQNELRLAGKLASQLDQFVEHGLAESSLYIVSDAGVTTAPAEFDGLSISYCTPFRSVDRDLQICSLQLDG